MLIKLFRGPVYVCVKQKLPFKKTEPCYTFVWFGLVWSVAGAFWVRL